VRRERGDVRLGTDRGDVEESFKVGRSERERERERGFEIRRV